MLNIHIQIHEHVVYIYAYTPILGPSNSKTKYDDTHQRFARCSSIWNVAKSESDSPEEH